MLTLYPIFSNYKYNKKMDSKKHIKLYQRNLQLFPEQYTPYDSSRTSLVYFCISGLAVLQNGEIENRNEWINWVYEQMVESKEGFRGSSSHKLCDEKKNIYDVANIASTYFCLSMLSLLRDDSITQNINRDQILKYVTKCQRNDGSFAGCCVQGKPIGGERDARYTYMATAICIILNVQDLNSIFNVKNAVGYVKSSKNYDGGIGDSPGGESHSGLTYCGIAALKLMNELDSREWMDTIGWLSRRQYNVHTNKKEENDEDGEEEEEEESIDNYGGFNGRCNKPADTCYSFWCGATLKMLTSAKCYDYQINENYLLYKTQHPLVGGFCKYEGALPDPLHSYLGLASLELQNSNSNFDPVLCLPEYASNFIKSLNWS